MFKNEAGDWLKKSIVLREGLVVEQRFLRALAPDTSAGT